MQGLSIMESLPRTQKRIEWVPNWDEFFAGLLVDQVNKGKKIEKGFSKESWCYMTHEFNRKFYQNLNKDQLKHRHGYFRKEYNMAHPEAKPFQRRILPLHESLGIIFGNPTADGSCILSSHNGEASKEANDVMLTLQSPTTFSDSPDVLHEDSLGSRDDESTPIQPKHRRSTESLRLFHGKRTRKGPGEIMAEALQEIAASARYRVTMSVANGRRHDTMKDRKSFECGKCEEE
ncbi:hypothetical protein AMTR_s00114p00074070 [Amborella trichopoda]|uniref:Myb/SANT-like domain-containing protein n=1 Tax=Amborella trichopoda TaxID=13333 RepID=W1NW43_AMBTC|nr:hypothetical protein AMTR_s00114p00074070 [Amborella trichopoda]